jgi:hypothetical protein
MLLPATQLTFLSVAKYRTDWFNGYGFPVRNLVTLVWPPNHTRVCDLLYCGNSGLLLAIAALMNRTARKSAAVVGGLGVLSGIWMLGTATPFGRAVWALTPGLVKGSLYPHYAMATFCLCIAALAAIGLDRVSWLSTPQKYGVALLVAADLIVVNSGRPMNGVDVRKEPGISREQIDGSKATLTRLRQLTGGVPPLRTDTHESAAAFATTAPLTQIVTANGYNPMALERLIQVRLAFAKAHRWGAWYEVADVTSPVVDALNIGYLLSGKRVRASVGGRPKFALAAELPGFFAYQNLSALPRFWLVHQVRRVATPQEAFDEVHKRDFLPAEYAIVERMEGVSERAIAGFPMPNSGPSPRHTGDNVRVIGYEATKVILALRSDGPGFLVTSEAQYPGWHARVDGADAPIFFTNGAFRGLIIPPGEHTVMFWFLPSIVWIGAGITGISILGIAGLLVGFGRRSKWNG